MSEARDAGYQALQQGDVAGAVARLEEAAQQNPQDYLAHLYLGAAYGQAGRHAEAVQALTRAVQLDPSNAQARYNLGIALERAGWREQAITALQQALQLRPDYEMAKAALQRLMPPPAVTFPMGVTPSAGASPRPGGYGPGYGAPMMPPLYTFPCRVCGTLLAYGRIKCPRCETPPGLIADPNSPVPAYVPIGGYPPAAKPEAAAALPPEVERRKWSWGAFGLSGIWCLAHGMTGGGLLLLVCYGLGFVPIYQILFLPVYVLACIWLGFSGNRLAWQKRRYNSINQFLQTERIWGYWGIGVGALMLTPLVLDAVLTLTG